MDLFHDRTRLGSHEGGLWWMTASPATYPTAKPPFASPGSVTITAGHCILAHCRRLLYSAVNRRNCFLLSFGCDTTLQVVLSLEGPLHCLGDPDSAALQHSSSPNKSVLRWCATQARQGGSSQQRAAAGSWFLDSPETVRYRQITALNKSGSPTTPLRFFLCTAAHHCRFEWRGFADKAIHSVQSGLI